MIDAARLTDGGVTHLGAGPSQRGSAAAAGLLLVAQGADDLPLVRELKLD